MVAFVAYLVRQHWMVFPYHDDWGIAVLDYGVSVGGFQGRAFSLSQAIDFFSQLYLQWSGRVVPFFIQAYTFKAGIDAGRTVQVITILLAVLLASRLGSGQRAIGWTVAIPIVLYLAIPLFVAARGIYWFNASSHSLWGVPLLFGGAAMCSRAGRISAGASGMLAAAALFNEMMAAAALVLLATQVAAQLPEAKQLRRMLGQVALCIPACLSACFVVLAPGNFARAEQSEYVAVGPWANALASLTRIGELVMQHPSARAFVVLWAIAVACLFAVMIVRCPWPVALRTLAVSIAAAALGVLVPAPGALLGMGIATALPLLALRRLPGAIVALGLLLGAAASLVPLLASPGIYPRSLINFYLCMFVPITWSLATLACIGPRWAILSAVGLAVGALPAFENASAIHRGYLQSYPFHRFNERTLESVAADVRSGAVAPASIPYYVLPTVRYSEVMPYQKPAIETWMKKYYGLPKEIRFDYRPAEELPGMGAP